MINNLSVIMPTFNCGEYLSTSIQSILSQSFKNFELIIINDGSTDDTDRIVKQFNDNRIRYEKIEHSGVAKASNYGLLFAKYDWIARMDADDISLPYRFETQVNFLNRNPNYNVISSWYALFNSNRITHVFELPVTHSEITEGLNLHSTLCNAGSMFLKKLINDFGWYYDKPFGEDYDFWLRIKDKALFYNIPQVLILVRSRKDSLHRGSNKKKEEILSIQRLHLTSYDGSALNKFSKEKNYNIEGWREWFYGDKKKARKVWLKNVFGSLSNVRVLLAILLSFLPNSVFEYLKELNIRARINCYFHLDRRTKKKLKSIIT